MTALKRTDCHGARSSNGRRPMRTCVMTGEKVACWLVLSMIGCKSREVTDVSPHNAVEERQPSPVNAFSPEFRQAQERATSEDHSCDRAGMKRRERWLQTPLIEDCVESDCTRISPHRYGLRIEGACGDALSLRDGCNEARILELGRSDDGLAKEFRAAIKIGFRTYVCREVDMQTGQVGRPVEVPLDFVVGQRPKQRL